MELLYPLTRHVIYICLSWPMFPVCCTHWILQLVLNLSIIMKRTCSLRAVFRFIYCAFCFVLISFCSKYSSWYIIKARHKEVYRDEHLLFFLAVLSYFYMLSFFSSLFVVNTAHDILSSFQYLDRERFKLWLRVCISVHIEYCFQNSNFYWCKIFIMWIHRLYQRFFVMT